MYDIFHLKLFKYWALEWRGTPSLLTRQNVFLAGVESAPMGWRTMDDKELYIHKYKFVLCPFRLNWSCLKFNHESVVGYSLWGTRMISDLYNGPFSRSSLKCLACLFAVFLPFSFRIQYVRLSLKVVVQFRLSAVPIHNKTYFIIWGSHICGVWILNQTIPCHVLEYSFIHSFSSLSFDRSRVFSKSSSPAIASWWFLFQIPVSCLFLKGFQ